MGVKTAIEELEKQLQEQPKVLYENKWLSLCEVDGYVYSHESRSNGRLVAILVIDSKKHPGQVYGRFEACPAHFDGRQLTSITGGVEKDDPMATAIMELEEEGSVKVKEHLEIDPNVEFGISLDGCIHVEKITSKVIEKFIRDFNEDTLQLDDTLYSFQTEDEEL